MPDKSLWFRADDEWVEVGKGHVIEDEGVALPQRKYLDFVGADVTVTDDSVMDKSVVTVGTVAAPVTPFYTAITDLAPLRSLLGYWRLGESASPFADSSGYSPAAPATEIGSGTAVTKDVTGALPVGDDDGAVQINEEKYVNGNEPIVPRRFNLEHAPMSVAAWVKPLSVTRTFNACIAGSWADAGFGNCGWTLLLQQSPTYQIVSFSRREVGTPAQSATAGPIAIPQDEYSFVVGTYAASGEHKLYINGDLVAVAFNAGVTSMPTFNNGVQIGYGGTVFLGGGSPTLHAAIDEVSVWGAPLTASEIAELAVSGGLITSPTDPIISASGNYTATALDNTILASGNTVITLPTAVGINGTDITIKNVGTGTITVARTSSEKIDGTAANVTISTTQQVRRFLSDGLGWQIVEGAL